MKSKIVVILLLTLVAGATLSSQNSKRKFTINGLVVDTDRNPVVDAIIMIDNNMTSKTTNHYGSYKIKVEQSAEKIGIYTDKTGVIEEPINGRKTINFTLTVTVHQKSRNQKNPTGEEEMNIGYGSVKKKELTQPVNKLDGRNNKYASYTNVYEMIKGEIPGVRVSGSHINIQGSSSINSSTEPLFVVDGMSTEFIDNISPQLVKSIEVLKGAAATIYGARGANGVILINLISAKDVK